MILTRSPVKAADALLPDTSEVNVRQHLATCDKTCVLLKLNKVAKEWEDVDALAGQEKNRLGKINAERQRVAKMEVGPVSYMQRHQGGRMQQEWTSAWYLLATDSGIAWCSESRTLKGMIGIAGTIACWSQGRCEA